MSASSAAPRAVRLPWLHLPEPAPFVHGRERLFRPTSAQHRERCDVSAERRPLVRDPGFAAERRLGGVELLLGGNGQAASVGHGDEVAEMPELHSHLPCLASMGPAYKVFFRRASGLYIKCARGLPDRQGA